MRARVMALALLCAQGLHAVEGAPYLKGVEGPRSSGMAGAFAAVPGSAESLWYNPAGLSGLRGAEGSFSHQSLAGGYDTDHILLAAYLGWQQSVGLMYSRKAASDVYRDAFGADAGSFQVSNSVIGLGYAYDFSGDLSLGLAGKMLMESVDDQSGSATVFDAGLQGKLSGERVLWGLSAQNFGSAPVLGTPPPGLDLKAPLTLRAGAGFQAGEPAQAFTLLGDFRYLLESGRSGFALGAEYSEVYADNSLALRAGYDFGMSGLGGLSGLSLGAGFGYKFLSFDYSYLPLDVLGASHRVALTLTYDQKADAQEKSLTDFLGITETAKAAAPTPTPTPVRAASDKQVGPDLDALLAATPTPAFSPTPVVSEKPKEEAKGIMGAITNIFSFGRKKEPGAEDEEGPKRPGGLLKGFFGVFGVEEEGRRLSVPEEPSGEIPAEERFSGDEEPTPEPSEGGRRRSSVPTPEPEPTPVTKKIKKLLSF